MMAGRIFVDVTHPVPAIRWDARGGRERLARLVGRTRTELRVVPETTFVTPSAPSRGKRAWGDPNEPWFEGRTWTRLPHAALDAFSRHIAEGGALDSYLRLPFSELLTLKVGEAHIGGPEPTGVRERYEAEASAYYRSVFAHNVAYDGRSVWLANDEHPVGGSGQYGRNQPGQWISLTIGLTALEFTVDLRPIDPELERLSAPVRRWVARNAVGAVDAKELPDACRALLRLCEAVNDRYRRGTKAAITRGWPSVVKGFIEWADEHARPSHEDAESLSKLAP